METIGKKIFSKYFRRVISLLFAVLLFGAFNAQYAAAYTVIINAPNSPEYTLGADWTIQSGGDHGPPGNQYTRTTSTTGVATFRPILKRSGTYRVKFKHKKFNNNDEDALYTIYHADGVTEQSIDQKTQSNHWETLGDFYFNSGSSGYVTISRKDGRPDTQFTVADMMKFKLQAETFEISDFPLDIQTRPAPPNIMFVLDDSGSMDWEFMTPESSGEFLGNDYVFDNPGDNQYWSTFNDEERRMWKSQWFAYNKLYYNPGVNYTHWPDLPNAAVPPAATRSHPIHAGHTLQLDNEYLNYDSVSIPRAHYYVYSDAEDKPYLVIINDGSSTIQYYEVSDTSNGDGSTQKIDDLT
ncbi:MAG: hypothetical protein KAR13_02605, partial [Desulfobulbaceae bacterium]|nr:hypothetical protein [Desulfobulbaceae bacterium]